MGLPVALQCSGAGGAASAAMPKRAWPALWATVWVTVSMQAMETEMNVLRELDHFNIVRFYGGSLDLRKPFLVTELMHSSLEHLIHGK